jgi:hypothetical protein
MEKNSQIVGIILTSSLNRHKKIIMKNRIWNKFPSSFINGIIKAWYSYMRAVRNANNGYQIYDIKEVKQSCDKGVIQPRHCGVFVPGQSNC